MVRAGLTSLGWFSVGRQHRDVVFTIESIDPLTEVVPNSIGLAPGNERSIDRELGSVLAQKDWMFFIDVFAENDTVGLHLVRDIQDILEGRFPSIGRSTNVLPVYDYTQATPTVIFSCLLEDCIVDKAQLTEKSWQRHWWACSVTVRDEYRDEDG